MTELPLFAIGLGLAVFAPFMVRVLVARLRGRLDENTERIRARARQLRSGANASTGLEAKGESGDLPPIEP